MKTWVYASLQIQKFALRFLTIDETEKFMNIVKVLTLLIMIVESIHIDSFLLHRKVC